MASLQQIPAPASPLWRGSLAQQLRIWSGLILFTFVFFHLVNHALGIWSIAAMDAFQAARTAVTRSVPGTILLGGALLTHLTLNLYKIARRSTWRMPRWEAAQIGLALLIPVLLALHAAPMRAQFDLEGSATRYSDKLPDLWGQNALPQIVLVIIVWTHGSIGLHYWLRLSRGYGKLAPYLLSLAVLVPTLALCGFVVAGRDAAEQARNRPAAAAGAAVDGYEAYDGYDGYGGTSSPPAAAPALTADDVQRYAVWTAWALLAIVAAAVAVQTLQRFRHRRIRITYADGPTVRARVGPTLLEISRLAGVPHTSICGGRARCSTCRVRVDAAADELPAPKAAEAATLARIRAEPLVRLACQLRPNADLTVTRLVRAPDERRGVNLSAADVAGVEQTLAILFLDIRGFTTLSEARLPYDTVFLLNRFFAEVGEAVTGAGGWIDKYLGDGLMALFGLHQPAHAACRAALVAAMRIDAALEHVNRDLGAELAAPLRIGIGLHVGPLVLGRIGHRASASVTVIGPAVNVASRLESLTKEHEVQIIASAALMEAAGLHPGAFPESVVTVRGASDPMRVGLVKRGRDLAPFLDRLERRPAA